MQRVEYASLGEDLGTGKVQFAPKKSSFRNARVSLLDQPELRLQNVNFYKTN